MPGANCSIYCCGTCRNQKAISIFTLPNAKKNEFHKNWNRELVNIITRDREITADFRHRIEANKVYICERHFDGNQIYICKYILFSL